MALFKKKKSVPVKSFSEKLSDIKGIFKSAYEGAIELNNEITEDNKVKKIEIEAIQAQIDFNNKVLEDGTRFVGKLKDLLA